jgi:signal transduction histidine kinase
MNAVLPFPSHGESPSQTLDLSELIHEVCDDLDTKRVASRVSIEIDAPPYTMIHADRARLRQTIENLLLATFAASPLGSDVVLTTFSDETGVELEIASGGAFPVDGAASAVPLLSAADRQGVWSEIRRTVNRDGAEISVGDCPDGGLAFTLHFPREAGESDNARRAA